MIKPCECESYINNRYNIKGNYNIIVRHIETNIFSDIFYCHFSSIKVTKKEAIKNLQEKVKNSLDR